MTSQKKPRKLFKYVLITGIALSVGVPAYSYLREVTREKRRELKRAYKQYKAFNHLSKETEGIEFGGGEEEAERIRATRIAHGGGIVDGTPYTNTLEALETNYEKGFRLFEIDMEWTSDGEIVCLHDWRQSLIGLFQEQPRRLSLEEFKQLRLNGISKILTQMSFDDLANWLKDHESAYIITDIKKDNVKALSKISREYGDDITERIIPQIYLFDELAGIASAGYKHYILTLYRSNYSDSAIVDFAQKYRPFAVTMPIIEGVSELPRKLKRVGIQTYVHTVNSPRIYKMLEGNEVYGIYTDSMDPEISSGKAGKNL